MAEDAGNAKRDNATVPATSLVDGLERFGKLSGFLTAAALSLSVFYDWSFLQALGLEFAEVPTTLADHLRSALVWLPGWVAVLSLLALLELVNRLVEGFRSETEIIQGSRNPVFTRRLRRSGDVAVLVAMALGVFTLFLFGTSRSVYYSAFMLAWGVLSLAAITHPRAPLTRWSALGFVMVPFVVAYIGMLGSTRAEGMLNANPEWLVTLKVGDSTEIVRATGVRRFGSVAVVVEPARKLRIPAIVIGDSGLNVTGDSGPS